MECSYCGKKVTNSIKEYCSSKCITMHGISVGFVTVDSIKEYTHELTLADIEKIKKLKKN